MSLLLNLLFRLSVEEKLYRRDIDKAIRISLSMPTSTDEEKNIGEEDNAREVKSEGLYFSILLY